ncbi:MAG: hypothetical protein IPO67_01565 [Deltaproteobacteria bacterium]|nr:hypothetical protein [Deltaproteobacteria bacterium]
MIYQPLIRATLTLVGFAGTLSFAQVVWASKCLNDPGYNGAELLRLTVKVDGEHVPEEDPISLGWSTVGHFEYYESLGDDGSLARATFWIGDIPTDGDSFNVPVDVTR